MHMNYILDVMWETKISHEHLTYSAIYASEVWEIALEVNTMQQNLLYLWFGENLGTV